MDLQYDIFIAYKREDREKANSLKVIFEQQGWRVFIDTDINAGARFSMELEHALEASRSVVVLWSEASKQSRYVLDEANEGAERGALFPALIESTRIPYGFRQFQAVDLVQWQGESEHNECGRLIEALANYLGQGSSQSEVKIEVVGDSDVTSPTTTPIRKPGDIYRDTLKDGSQGPEMVIIPAGSFLMGSPEGEGRDNEHPQHEVTIDQPFSMGRFAVSSKEYAAFCLANRYEGPKRVRGRGKKPATKVSWSDALAFCNWLSDETQNDYSLPSETYWEYTCKARTATPWYTGERLMMSQANFGNNFGKPVDVDFYEPNDFGLYQCHGNVWEWCTDPWCSGYKLTPDTSDIGHDNITQRVLKGGSWSNDTDLCRSAYRFYSQNNIHNDNVGFRLCCLSPSKL